MKLPLNENPVEPVKDGRHGSSCSGRTGLVVVVVVVIVARARWWEVWGRGRRYVCQYERERGCE